VSTDIDSLILSGALEPAGIDLETGEMLYNFTPKLKQINPELFDIANNDLYSQISDLWVNGFVELDMLSNNPYVKLTPNAFNESLLSTLSRDMLHTLNEIKRVIYEN